MNAVNKYFTNRFFLCYYFLLLFVLCSWSNSESLPPIYLRIIYIACVTVPLILMKHRLYPIIVLTLVVISSSSYAVSYMPVEGLYIFIIFIIGFFLIKPNPHLHIQVSFPILFLGLISMLVDLIYSNEIFISFHLFSLIVTCYFIPKANNEYIRIMSYSFILISLVLSLEFVFLGDKFISSVNTFLGVFDRKGWADPNYFCSILGYGICACFIELLVNRKNANLKSNLFIYVILFLSIYTLVTAASRGTIVAISCFTFVIIFFSSMHLKQRFMIISLLSVTGILMYYLGYLDLIILRFLSDAGDAGGRTNIWIDRLYAFINDCNPIEWIVGIGRERSLYLGTSGILGSHNDFVATLVSYGFIGLFTLIIILLQPVLRANKNKALILALVSYLAVCMFSIEPFTGGQWGCLYFYIYLQTLSQSNYGSKI